MRRFQLLDDLPLSVKICGLIALDNPRLPLHCFQRFRNEGRDLVILFAAVGKRLIEAEVGQRQAAQG